MNGRVINYLLAISAVVMHMSPLPCIADSGGQNPIVSIDAVQLKRQLGANPSYQQSLYNKWVPTYMRDNNGSIAAYDLRFGNSEWFLALTCAISTNTVTMYYASDAAALPTRYVYILHYRVDGDTFSEWQAMNTMYKTDPPSPKFFRSIFQRHSSDFNGTRGDFGKFVDLLRKMLRGKYLEIAVENDIHDKPKVILPNIELDGFRQASADLVRSCRIYSAIESADASDRERAEKQRIANERAEIALKEELEANKRAEIARKAYEVQRAEEANRERLRLEAEEQMRAEEKQKLLSAIELCNKHTECMHQVDIIKSVEDASGIGYEGCQRLCYENYRNNAIKYCSPGESCSVPFEFGECNKRCNTSYARDVQDYNNLVAKFIADTLSRYGGQ